MSPKSVVTLFAEPSNPAQLVHNYCVGLFTYVSQYEKPDPYDQTYQRAKVACKIKPNSEFEIKSMKPRGDGACDAYEQALNQAESSENEDDPYNDPTGFESNLSSWWF